MDLSHDPTTAVGKGQNSSFKAGYYQNIKENNIQLEKTISMLSRLNVLDNGVFFYLSDHSLKGKMERKRDWLKSNTFNHTMAKNYKGGDFF